ncbi:hypothetical protein PFISCL1PPCAC_23690, partial [Pristionchus fissidentatus]
LQVVSCRSPSTGEEPKTTTMDWDRDRKQYLRDYTKDKGENETRRIYEEEVRALSSNLTKQIERVKKLEKEKRESDNNRAKRMKNMESGVRAVGRSEQVRDVEKELRERIDTLTLSNKQKDEALRVKWSQAATDGVVAALAAAGVDSAPNRDGVFPDLSAERLKMPRHLRHSR